LFWKIKHLDWYVVFLVVLVYGLDQLTKMMVIRLIPMNHSVPEHGIFRLTHIANSGSAFGLFVGQNLALTLISLVGVGVIIYFYRISRSMNLLVRTSLSLILAGALGNLTDRLINGHVTDFIDIGPWYIFNLADSSIVVGLIAFGLSGFFPKESKKGMPQDLEGEDGERHAG
jgi:signal peptidase II